MAALCNPKNANGLKVEILDSHGTILWSFGSADGLQAGSACTGYIKSGMQQRIIDALLLSLIQARSELGGAFPVSNIVPYVGSSAAQIDDCVPVV